MVKLGAKPKIDDPKYKGFPKPTSGYFKFCSEHRAQTIADVRKEMGAAFRITFVPKRLSQKWNAEVGEAQKAKYHEEYEKEQVGYKEKYAVWKVTPEAKLFFIDQAKFRKHKKLRQVTRDAKAQGMPKRPMNPYSVYADTIRADVIETLKNAGGPDAKFSLSAVGKKLAEEWKKLPDAEKASWKQKSEEMKEQSKKDMEEWLVSEAGIKYKKTLAKIQGEFEKATGVKPTADKTKGKSGDVAVNGEDPLAAIEELEQEDDDDEEGEAVEGAEDMEEEEE